MDDIAIKYENNDDDDLFNKMQKQNDLYILGHWFSENKLVLNAKKSKYIILKRKMSVI